MSCWGSLFIYVKLSSWFLCGPKVTVGQQLKRKTRYEMGENRDNLEPHLSLIAQHCPCGCPAEEAVCFTSELTRAWPGIGVIEEDVVGSEEASTWYHPVPTQ